MIKSLFLSLIVVPSLVFSSEWIVYGATKVDLNEVIDNPSPNVLGVIGEVVALPYTVPEGHTLTIKSMQIEGPACDYFSNSSQLGMGIWLGNEPCTNEKWLASCTTVGGSHQNLDMNIRLPAGTIVNVRLMNNTPYAWVDGWYIQGELN